jgi:serine/threonine protein kinase
MQGSSAQPESCVLKFFALKSRAAYDKEVAVYWWLHNSGRTMKNYSRLLGYDQWMAAKYVKTIGRGIKSILSKNPDPHIYVLMLKDIENSSPMSSVTITPAIAAAALTNLAILHETGVVHGDISTDNILVLEEEESVRVFWIDFSSSCTNASSIQTAWEMDRAAEYFSQWVMPF